MSATWTRDEINRAAKAAGLGGLARTALGAALDAIQPSAPADGRAEFEAWARGNFHMHKGWTIEWHEDHGPWINTGVTAAEEPTAQLNDEWVVWQAAWAAARSREGG